MNKDKNLRLVLPTDRVEFRRFAAMYRAKNDATSTSCKIAEI
jgi:hypothetical protein